MNEIRKINVSDLMIKILKQWRKILVFALVIGMLTGVIGVLKMRNGTTETNTNTKRTVYSEQDQKTYDRQEEALKRNEEFYNIYNDYLKNSIKMQINPDKVFEGKVECLISGNSEKEILRLKNEYEEVVKDTAFCDQVREKLNITSKDAYIYEIISSAFKMYENETGLLEFVIIHFDKNSCQDILEILKNELQSVQLEGSQCEIIEDAVVETSRLSLATEQDTYYGLKWSYYDKLKQVEIDRKNLEISYQTTPIKQDLKSNHFSIFYLAIGFIAGAILGVIYFGMKYLFSDFIHGKEDIGGLQEVSIVTITDENKSFKCIIDRWIYKLEKRIGNIPTNSVEMSILPVIMSANKKNVTGICLTGTLLGEDYDDQMIEIVKEIFAKYDFKVSVMNSFLNDLDSMKRSVDISKVVLYEVCEKTSHKKLCEEVLRLQQCGIGIEAIILEK